MFDQVFQMMVCFGFVLILVPLILCIVLATKQSGLRERIEKLEIKLAHMAQELKARGGVAPRQGTAATPQAPAAPVRPAGAGGTTEQLLGRLEEIKQKEKHPEMAMPTAAVAAPMQPHVPTPARAVHVPPPLPGPARVHPTAGPVPPAPARPATPAAAPQPLRKPRSLEYYINSAFIVVGAIAAALAVIFGVKIGIEKGVFGPLQRDCASAIVALGLLGVGQWRRRQEGFWSQGLTAAGVVSLFAALVAATSVHHFLTPIEGFLLLALTTAGAVAMSLQDWSGAHKEGGKARGGLLIATLGLIGGFLTPALVNSGHDDVPGLFGYLILLHVGLVFATRMRGWTVLAAASTILASLWLMLWVLFKWDPAAHPHEGAILGLFMLAAAGSLVVSTIRGQETWRGGKAGLAAMGLTWLGVGMGMLSACLLIGRSQFDNLQWSFFAVLVLGAFVLARLRRGFETMAWWASMAALAMLTLWGLSAGMLTAGNGPDMLAEHARFTGWLLGFGGATVLGAFACQWKNATPARWARLANLSAMAYTAVAYWLVPMLPRADSWGLLPVTVAGGLGVLLAICLLRRAQMPEAEACLTAYGHGIVALLLMAAPMGLSGAEQTAAWAALLPVVALGMWRLKLPGLAAGFLVTLLLAAVRGVMIGALFDGSGAGGTLWWNPVVWTYGSMVAAMALAAWLLEQCKGLPEGGGGWLPGPKTLSDLMQAGAAIAAFMLLSLEVRWGFHDGKLGADFALLGERGTYALGWLLLAAAIVWIGQKMQRKALTVIGEIAAILALFYGVAVLVVITNPLWYWEGMAGDITGMPVFNLLLFAYGLPAAACGLLAWTLGRAEARKELATAAGAVGVVLLVTMVTLQVRQGFVGPRLLLGVAGVSFRELSTYTIAWLTVGSACLAIGRRWNRTVLWNAGIWVGAGAMMYGIGVVGILLSPMLQHENVGTWKVANELLYAYGVPLGMAWLAGAIADPRAVRLLGPLASVEATQRGWRLMRLMRVAMLMLAFILVTTQVRQWFEGAYLDLPEMAFLERGTYGVMWLALAGVLLALGYGRGAEACRRGGLIIAGAALAWTLGVCAVVMNPLWTGESVGGIRIFNGLLYAYGLPAAGLTVLGVVLSRRSAGAQGRGAERWLAWAAHLASLALVLVLVTLEVQYTFRGDHLSLSPAPAGTPAGEFLAYSLAWAVLGLIYLAVGIWRRSALMRWASLVMMGLTIFKVFLLDMPALQDFQRVLSFGGLGLALMGLGLVYYRLVFRLAPGAGEELPPQGLAAQEKEG